MAALMLAVALLAPGFSEPSSGLEKPIWIFVALMAAAGFAYLYVVLPLSNEPFSKGGLLWILSLGLFLRLLMFLTPPILENDHLRYLWDGGVTASGHNPYRYAPQEILEDEEGRIPGDLVALAERSGQVVRGINHPWLKTIYPPAAQAAFALAYLIQPWSITAWRLLLLAVDGVTLCLLFTLFRTLGLPAPGIAVYWLNPLLIKEIYNSGHMDILVFPVLLGAVHLVVRKRLLAATAVLGLGVGIKVWPAVLMPLLWIRLLRRRAALVLSSGIFVGLSAMMLLPLVEAGLNETSGFAVYMGTWEMNDALYMVLLWAVQVLIGVFGPETLDPHVATRMLTAGMLGAWVLVLSKKPHEDPSELIRRMVWTIAALFFLSPTQFPWYSLWFLPLLAVEPQKWLLYLTPLMPLYYLRFDLEARGMVRLYDYGIVWLQYVPVWCMLLWEGRKEIQAQEALR